MQQVDKPQGIPPGALVQVTGDVRARFTEFVSLLFEAMDLDHNGIVEREEVAIELRKIELSEEDISNFLEQVPEDGANLEQLTTLFHIQLTDAEKQKILEETDKSTDKKTRPRGSKFGLGALRVLASKSKTKSAATERTSAEYVPKLFRAIDLDQDGCIDADEVVTKMKSLHIGDREISSLVDQMPKEGINLAQFVILYEKVPDAHKQEISERFEKGNGFYMHKLAHGAMNKITGLEHKALDTLGEGVQALHLDKFLPIKQAKRVGHVQYRPEALIWKDFQMITRWTVTAGSVLPKAMIWAIISALLAAVLWLYLGMCSAWNPATGQRISSNWWHCDPDLLSENTTVNGSRIALETAYQQERKLMTDPFTFKIGALVMTFSLLFRTQISYNRYWESCTGIAGVGAFLMGIAGSALAFDSIYATECAPVSDQPAIAGKVGADAEALVRSTARFKRRILHLMSLLHAVTLIELRRAAEPDEHWPDRYASILTPYSGQRSKDIDHFELPVFGGLSIDTLDELKRATVSCDECLETVIQWVHQAIIERIKSGGLRVPPPTASSLWSQFSFFGMAHSQLKCVSTHPFPFPYAQFIVLVLLIATFLLPIIMAYFAVDGIFCTVITTLSVTMCFTFELIAREMEVPFGSDANDLDMVKTHLDFCAGLESMLDLAGTCESAKVHGFAHCCDDIGVAAMPKDWAPDSSIFVVEAEASAMADGSGHSNNAPNACDVRTPPESPTPTQAPAAALAGGYRSGDSVFYVGQGETFSNGDKLVRGCRGEVVGPAVSSVRTKGEGISVAFGGNKNAAGCFLDELSREPPSTSTDIEDSAEGAVRFETHDS